MRSQTPSRFPQQRWRRLSFLFLSLLPALAVFHAVMWFCFTRTLFRPETGDLKRMGYLVGLEDVKGKLMVREPQSGYTVLSGKELAAAGQVPTMVFGDSFAPSLAKAYSLQASGPGESFGRVGLVGVNWEQGNGLMQLKSWLADDWFRAHGVKTIILERVEYAWLDTFADEGDPAQNIPWSRQLSGDLPAHYEKAAPWSFANNGNFKVLFCNVAYLFSPTGFKLTDTCMVRLKQKFFTCSYGDRLLFYRGEAKGALTDRNRPRVEQALNNLQELSDLCSRQGLNFYLVVPPVKSYLYYDWIERPFYPDSKMLEMLQVRGKAAGYVDLKQIFHQRLEAGVQDLYYADDAHWNFPAAQMAAEELAKAGAMTTR